MKMRNFAKRVAVAGLMALALLSMGACDGEPETDGPSISEILPFQDRAVDSIDFYGGCWMEGPDGEETLVYCRVTEQEDRMYILSTLRSLEPLSYNYDGFTYADTPRGAYFIFNLDDGRRYTIAYFPQATTWQSEKYDMCASLDNDVVRINVPFYQDFLNTIGQMDYENVYSRNPNGSHNVEVPQLGYSEPGDPPLERYPYDHGSTPRP